MADSMTDSPVALITGAGSGVGRAAAMLLARRGYHVALAGRREEALRETASLIGGVTLVVSADISQPEQARGAVDRVAAQSGRLDVIINNAGLAELRPIDAVDDALLQRLFAVNVFGPAHLVARAWPIFLRQKQGCVVNVSSMATLDPFAGLSAYAAAKSALESLTRSIMNERGEADIRAFTVAPGAIETEMLRGIVSADILPTEQTLVPDAVAEVIVQCIVGQREADIGRIIRLPSP
ncbi:MAG TPA: SDR family oxidoreductase [Phycisphaerales bacterium]|nr:SDR family oxidoreductase [Phycisphaerales bacterium]